MEAISVSVRGKRIIQMWQMNTVERLAAVRDSRLDIAITSAWS